MWYHPQGNSLSVSTRHSHLGKLGSKCRGHPIVHRQLHPPPFTVISLSLKGVPNRVTCPQVQVFLLMRNYKYLLTKFILFLCNMKYETWEPSMHWPWINKDTKSSPSRDSNKVTAPPMYIHNIQRMKHGHHQCIDRVLLKILSHPPPEMLKTL